MRLNMNLFFFISIIFSLYINCNIIKIKQNVEGIEHSVIIRSGQEITIHLFPKMLITLPGGYLLPKKGYVYMGNTDNQVVKLNQIFAGDALHIDTNKLYRGRIVITYKENVPLISLTKTHSFYINYSHIFKPSKHSGTIIVTPIVSDIQTQGCDFSFSNLLISPEGMNSDNALQDLSFLKHSKAMVCSINLATIKPKIISLYCPGNILPQNCFNVMYNINEDDKTSNAFKLSMPNSFKNNNYMNKQTNFQWKNERLKTINNLKYHKNDNFYKDRFSNDNNLLNGNLTENTKKIKGIESFTTRFMKIADFSNVDMISFKKSKCYCLINNISHVVELENTI